ncbi:FERM/acyl-CoA-binding protein, 3-helical bundle [Penicillium occitanis (nom. inval.)]|nr:hypothetical protein PENOC_028960 [Penicillium occitanis (nom. inval.)]PCH05828.1 FERM/acyl-CoA-binding protein, 3-helical bundle [Penicillium occitanis (nom. inval.)]
MSLQERFEQATVDVKRLNNATNSEKLEAKAKHDAWEKVRELSREEAQEQYIELFENLKEKYGLKPEPEKK